jgi:hypothetical protein
MANLIDFLWDYKHILKVNNRVTLLYIAYIALSFVTSLLGPSTVLLMIADTFVVSFGKNSPLTYYYHYYSDLNKTKQIFRSDRERSKLTISI